MMKNILQLKFNLNFSLFIKNRSNNVLRQCQNQIFAHTLKRNNNSSLATILGIFCSFYLLKNKLSCIERSKLAQSNQDNQQVQIYELNKGQFLQLLVNIEQQGILIVFNKYFRNQNEKQFAQKLQKLYNQSKQLKIKKIYLIQKHDIKHLQTFQKWLNHQKLSYKQNDQSTMKQNNSKADYFLLTPYFKNNPFKLDEEQINSQINQIRKYQIRQNPTNIKQTIFSTYQTKFNRTTVLKQCPDYIAPLKENQCIEDFRKKIATLIEQKMLKNKSEEFRFYAITPNSKKDFSTILSFHNNLKQHKKQEKSSSEGLNQQYFDSKKIENTYVLRNDLLGREIDNLKSFKKINYSQLKTLHSYDKFLLFIKPRVFTISKANSSIDLYWYVTSLQKNKQASISINNTDSFNLGRKYTITNGHQFPLNSDLQMLKILYKNYPQLNYLIVNTEIVSELIRHTAIKRKYAIFNLTSDLMYSKRFLPHYNEKLSVEDNYLNNFKPLIDEYLKAPSNYDSIIVDKQKKVNRKDLQQIMRQQKQKFVLRVCNLNCQDELTDQKLKFAFKKIIKKSEDKQNTKFEQNDVKRFKVEQNWKNKMYPNIYWIDSYFNNVGMKDGDYIFEKGSFSEL